MSYHAEGLCEIDNEALAGALTGKTAFYAFVQVLSCIAARERAYPNPNEAHRNELDALRNLLGSLNNIMIVFSTNQPVIVSYSGTVMGGFSVMPQGASGGTRRKTKRRGVRRRRSRRRKRSRRSKK
jgi:hypothetical protein